jgi:hypothetical protein
MNLGMLFLILSLMFFFHDGIGATVVPRALPWGLFSLVLGLLLTGVPVPFVR